MSNYDRKELLYGLAAIFLLIAITPLITIIHELGHGIAGILLGGEITEFVSTPFNGGSVDVHFDGTLSDYNYGITTAIIWLSGGLATALFFALVGFFKRTFLILCPVWFVQAFAETLQIDFLNRTMMQLFSFFIVCICFHLLYVKLWKGGATAHELIRR